MFGTLGGAVNTEGLFKHVTVVDIWSAVSLGKPSIQHPFLRGERAGIFAPESPPVNGGGLLLGC